MNARLESDLKKTMDIISSNWGMQNDYDDRTSNFIYSMKTLDECLNEIEKRKVNKEYALHRWYNYMTSIECEYIFCEFGAVHEKDLYNHDVDIYINSVPFDVKLTVYPDKLSDRPFDLETREGKNRMIQWFYSNQSQQNRKQLLNRLYVVCDASTSLDNMKMKCNFELMRIKIAEFMNDVKNGFNEITITDGGVEYKLKSDIIHLME